MRISRRIGVVALAAALVAGVIDIAPLRAVGQDAAAAASTADDVALRALLASLEMAVRQGNPDSLVALKNDSTNLDSLSRFAREEIRPGATRAVVAEADRQPLPGLLPADGFRTVVDAFAAFGNRARVATWQLDVLRASGSGALSITAATRLSSMDNIYHLALNTSRELVAKNFTVASEDLDLTLAEGSVFTVDTDQGVTGLVLLGRGEMHFHPAPEAERGQVKIFCGAEALDTRFDGVFVRVGALAAHADLSALSERPADPHNAKRADEIFRAESVKSFGIDLGVLARDSWSLLLGPDDFLAEIRTRKFGTLTYSKSASLAEDISLFDRARSHNISIYPSAAKLAARGRFYNEDDLVDYDVLDYNIDVRFSPERQWLEGRARLQLKIRSAPSGQLILRLANPLVVQSIVSDRFGRLFSLRVKDQSAVIVSLPALLMPETDLALTIDYGGRLLPQPANQEALAFAQGSSAQNPGQGQGSTQQLSPLDQMQARSSALDIMPDEALLRPERTFLYSNRNAWYPQSTVSDYATARIKITVPADLTCVATGEPTPDSPTLLTASDPTQSRKVFSFIASRPVRYLSFVASKFVPADRVTIAFDETPELQRASLASNAPSLAGEYNSIDLAVLANPKEVQHGRDMAARAADVAQFYRSIVGDSPYQTFSVALVESLLPGGHSPAYFAVLDQPLPTAPVTWRNDPAAFSGYPDFFLAHELAHQWWGQAVGWRNYHEQWLSEGLAQYFAALYAQHERGDEAFAAVLRQMRKWALDESPEGPVYFGYRVGHIRGDSRAFRAIVYDKAAIALHMLRRLIGDDAFFRGIRRFYAESRFEKAGSDDLRRAMEAESNRSLERFFERWIYGSTLPHLTFSSRVEQGAAGQELVLHFEQTGDIFDIPVTVTVRYADRSQDIVVPVTEASFETRVPIMGVLRSVEISKDDGTLAEVIKK